jgi:transcriptional regulator with XRE-family HTH domain
MQSVFQMRSANGLTQDHIAAMLDVDKGLVSKRLNGNDNLTLRTCSYMGTAMQCRVFVTFVPYENVGTNNSYNSIGSTGTINRPFKVSAPEPQTVNG